MKIGFVTVLAAAALGLASCAHTTEQTASLSEQEIHAELAAISEKLSDIRSFDREDRYRNGNHLLMQTMIRRSLDYGNPETYASMGRLQPELVSVSYPKTKVERLLKRQAQLQKQMADLQRATTGEPPAT